MECQFWRMKRARCIKLAASVPRATVSPQWKIRSLPTNKYQQVYCGFKCRGFWKNVYHRLVRNVGKLKLQKRYYRFFFGCFFFYLTFNEHLDIKIAAILSVFNSFWLISYPTLQLYYFYEVLCSIINISMRTVTCQTDIQSILIGSLSCPIFEIQTAKMDCSRINFQNCSFKTFYIF